MGEAGEHLPTTLTIAGSDSGGGAGAQADLLSIAANGAFGLTAITALTAQNPNGVSGVHAVPPDFVREQIEQVAKFFKIDSAKTGMLFNAEIIEVVADFFEKHPEVKFVLDPVMVATSGARLLNVDAIEALRTRLIPLADLVTPNLDEAIILRASTCSQVHTSLGSSSKLEEGDHASGMVEESDPVGLGMTASASNALADLLGVPVLLKGGHGAGKTILDVLAFPKKCQKNPALGVGDNQATETKIFESTRIEDINSHGSGCTLSAAIAAQLAVCARDGITRETLAEAVRLGCDYVRRAMGKPIRVAGENFIAHLR